MKKERIQPWCCHCLSVTFISKLEIIQIHELIWFCFELQNCGWCPSPPQTKFWCAYVFLSPDLTYWVYREDTRLGMDWTSPPILSKMASVGFLWTWPWKAPSKSFKSSRGGSISSRDFRPECEHCFAGFEKWSHENRHKRLYPRNCHVADCLGEEAIVWYWKDSSLAGQLSSGNMFWEEVLDLHDVSKSPRKEAPDAYLSSYHQSLNLLVPEQQANPFVSQVPCWVAIIFTLWVARYKCKRKKKVKCLKQCLTHSKSSLRHEMTIQVIIFYNLSGHFWEWKDTSQIACWDSRYN